MTNSELCEAVRAMPKDAEFCIKKDGSFAYIQGYGNDGTVKRLQKLCADYERLLAAAMDVFREHGEHIAVPQNPEWVELKAVIEATEK